jgi:hypothetical protein
MAVPVESHTSQSEKKDCTVGTIRLSVSPSPPAADGEGLAVPSSAGDSKGIVVELPCSQGMTGS